VPCAFCERTLTGELLAENDLAVAFLDAFPVTPGHSLIVPRRHAAEQAPAWALVASVTARLDTSHSPDGYNIGGTSARPPASPSRTRTCTSSRGVAVTSRILAAGSGGWCRARPLTGRAGEARG
jgi:hypothetical protein